MLVAGLGWPRFPYAVLQHAFMGDCTLVLSEYILEEARRTIKRIAPQRAQALEDFLKEVDYEIVAAPSKEDVVANILSVRDAADVPIALAAIAADLDCLVTQDKDLTENEALKQRVKVLLPAVFLRDYMDWTSEELEAIRHRTWDDLE